MADAMSESIKVVGFRHYVLAWLPTWWVTLASSTLMAGIGLGCALWAVVDQAQGFPIGAPVLVGTSMVIGSFAGIVVPITLAWFKDRSEVREAEHLKNRVAELEAQIMINSKGHQENAESIQRNSEDIKRVAVATQNIVDVAADVTRKPDERLQQSKEMVERIVQKSDAQIPVA